MTELLLNLLWLVVALAGMGLWVLRWARTARRRRQRREMLRSAIGLTCVLVLLFFAISLTDDLHVVPLLAEDIRSTRRVLEVRRGALADSDPETSAPDWAEVLPLAFFSPRSLTLERLGGAEPMSIPSGPSDVIQDRSPPAGSTVAL